MKITTVGLDLAKSVFTLQGVDERGNAMPAVLPRGSEAVADAARAVHHTGTDHFQNARLARGDH